MIASVGSAPETEPLPVPLGMDEACAHSKGRVVYERDLPEQGTVFLYRSNAYFTYLILVIADPRGFDNKLYEYGLGGPR